MLWTCMRVSKRQKEGKQKLPDENVLIDQMAAKFRESLDREEEEEEEITPFQSPAPKDNKCSRRSSSKTVLKKFRTKQKKQNN